MAVRPVQPLVPNRVKPYSAKESKNGREKRKKKKVLKRGGSIHQDSCFIIARQPVVWSPFFPPSPPKSATRPPLSQGSASQSSVDAFHRQWFMDYLISFPLV